MVQAKELRIGNIVKFGIVPVTIQGIHTQTIIRVGDKREEHFYVSNFVQFSNYYAAEAHNLEYIPLTPDILERCGFKKNRGGEMAIEINDIASHLELMQGSMSDNYYYPSLTQTPQGDEERTVYFNRINSLHQLQNLYHALTNQELNVGL